MHFYLFFLHRLVKEITYREFQRYHGNPPAVPVISDVDYESGTVVKCPMRWTKGALEALHKAAENYMMGLMEDANLLAIHARRVTLQPRDIQLAHRMWGEPNWMDIGYA